MLFTALASCYCEAWRGVCDDTLDHADSSYINPLPLLGEHLSVLGAIATLVTIVTELTTNRANMHLNGAGDRAKRATLFVELSNWVSLLSIQLVVSHCNF